MPAASRPAPRSTPAPQRSWCTLWSAVSGGSACPAILSAAPHSSSPPRPCPLRGAPAEAIPRIPDMRRCGTVRPPAAFRTASGKAPRYGLPPQSPPGGRRPPPLPPPSKSSNPPASHHAWLSDKSTSRHTQSPLQLEGRGLALRPTPVALPQPAQRRPPPFFTHPCTAVRCSPTPAQWRSGCCPPYTWPGPAP